MQIRYATVQSTDSLLVMIMTFSMQVVADSPEHLSDILAKKAREFACLSKHGMVLDDWPQPYPVTDSNLRVVGEYIVGPAL